MSDYEVISRPAPSRGCGDRIPGGEYGMVPLSPVGLPLDSFLFCPPKVIPDGLGLVAVGQTFVLSQVGGEDCGLIFDWIGEGYYPNITDFWEEGRRLGFSFRLQPSVARQAKAYARNFIIPVHARAFIHNWMEYPPRERACPRDKHNFWDPEWQESQDYFAAVDAWLEENQGSYDTIGHAMCSGYWWHDVVGGVQIDFEYPEVERHIGSIRYRAWPQPTDVKPVYEPGLIARLPLSHIEIVDGAPETEDRYEELKDGELPVYVVRDLSVTP